MRLVVFNTHMTHRRRWSQSKKQTDERTYFDAKYETYGAFFENTLDDTEVERFLGLGAPWARSAGCG
jgi:hypothetical protein